MNWKKEIKIQLIIILVALAITSIFVLPKYLIWQDNRNNVKAQFEIVDENNMNATQRLALKLTDDFHIGTLNILFMIPFGGVVVTSNLIRKL